MLKTLGAKEMVDLVCEIIREGIQNFFANVCIVSIARIDYRMKILELEFRRKHNMNSILGMYLFPPLFNPIFPINKLFHQEDTNESVVYNAELHLPDTKEFLQEDLEVCSREIIRVIREISTKLERKNEDAVKQFSDGLLWRIMDRVSKKKLVLLSQKKAI